MEPIFIVGHGLAGALLAHSLIDEGFKVYCTDAAIDHSASRVAAGLINPFIGPKLNIPLDFRNCIEANIRFFKKWENLNGETLFKEETLLRVFTSEHQVIKWKELSDSSEYAQSFVSEKNLNQMGIIGRWGAGETKSYRLDAGRFIQKSKQLLKSMDSWIEPQEADLSFISKQTAIFAEGYNVANNLFFNWLPFAPAQGEILELKGPHLPALSNGTWLLPHCGDKYLSGSTWKHTDLKSGPTSAGKSQIYRKLKFIPINEFQEVDHLSGIRSGTKDRNPIIGRHPTHHNLFIFNGFGSRGSTTIKLCADHLINFLARNIELPSKINLNRFMKHYRAISA